MNLDAVQMNTFAVDQSMMPVHPESMLEDSSITYEAAYSYDELFPSLPENELKLEAPAPDMGQWNQKMKLKTSVITQVFHVPVEERKFRDMNSQRFGEQGEQAKICSDIMQKTGAHIEISSSKDQSLTILVTGKEEAVLRARRLIVKELQTQATISIPIPKEHHRFILGKSGKKLSELELSTATKITVPRPDENSDLIKIVGTKEGIDRARHEIQLISDEQAKLAFERLRIEKIYHPFIFGPFCEVVNRIAAETGARINIPPPSVMKDEITIAGEKEAVALAKERVLQIYEDKKRNTQVVSVEVPKNQHRYIFGPRGQTIQEILEETGVSVELPPSESQCDTITLRGEQEKLGPALTLVYEKASSVKTDFVDAASWLHKYIIGKKGANIRQIMVNFPDVHVEFTDGQDKIKIEGPPQDVLQASKTLKQTIKDLLSRLTYEEIFVDPKYHRHIIGKNGANIKRIKQDTEVQIHIPTDNENGCIRIEGSHEGVANAKRELMEMAEKLANEVSKELSIEQRFHRNLIGARGENIREIRDRFNQVNITFPEPGHRSDKVILRGPKQDVNACGKYLMQCYEELKISNYVVEVPISKQNLKFIIGKGGANIRKIRDETNTRLDIPENTPNDMIIITGRKEDVLLAQDMIMDIQRGLDNVVETEIMIPAKLHNSIIGTKGRLVRSISEDCGGVQIRFPTENTGSDRVTIRGVKEDVQKAKKLLIELSNEKQLTSYTEEIKAKPEQHRYLIGKNGVNIKKVRERTGARIIFPNQNDEDRDTITIIGRKEDVLAAKKELMSTISDLDKTVETTVPVDPKHHRYFVSRGGEVVRQIVDMFGGPGALSISFPRINSNSDAVALKGLANSVEGAKKRILEIVEDLELRIKTELVVPRKHHRTMMGSKGTKVQGLEQQFNVNIKFPDKETAEDAVAEEVALNGDCHVDGVDYSKPKKCDIIVITGREEKCNAAKEALLNLVPVTAELDVPYDLHRFIIGQKGKDVRQMMETFDVNISIPPQYEQSDTIKITGTPGSVEEAVKALKERIQQLEAEKQERELRNHQTSFEVDPQYHPKIIGRGGAVITKIKTEHNVTINFPDRDSESDRSLITVIGYEKDVEAAKAAILKIVQEQEDMFRDEVRIDPRVHPRIIGSKGRNINKIMNDYRVEIRFPRSNDAEKDLVVISGAEEDVFDAKDHLLNLEEECLQDIKEQELMKAYTQPPSRYNNSYENDNARPKEFVVTGAPWDKKKAAPDTTNTEEFPSFGAAGDMPSKPVAWGPSRR